MENPLEPVAALERQPFEGRDFLVLGALLGSAGLFAAVAHFGAMPRVQSFVGLLVILAIGYFVSTNRRAINMRTVGWGLSPAGHLRPHRPQDGDRPTRLPGAGDRHLEGAELLVRRVGLRLRSARGPGRVAAHHDRGPRCRGRTLRRHLRLSGAADHHLRRRPDGRVLLPRHHAGRSCRPSPSP